MGAKFKSSKERIPRVFINIGATMDIPTGSPTMGPKGETFINGGLHYTTGVVGLPNSFKSTILHYMAITAADRISSATRTSIHSHDTELTMTSRRLEQLSSRAEYFPDTMFDEDDPDWVITSKDQYSGDEWLAELKDYTDEKAKDKKAFVEFQTFFDNNQKTAKLPVPTFVEIDSVAELEPETTSKMLHDSRKEDTSTSTLFMKKGLFKSKMFSMIPRMALTSGTYFLFSSHIGEALNIGASPYSQGPVKKLRFLSGDQKIKGVSDTFLYLVGNAWYARRSATLKNQRTKLAEYPTGDDGVEEELALVSIVQLRGKNGMSGYTLNLVISQVEGVLPSLTEFHNIKTCDRFGISGSEQNYYLDIMPDVKLSRTVVRSKLDSDKKLQRAVNITSELLQISQFYPQIVDRNLMCTPAELYEDIKKLGYDWDELLDTRGWYALNQYTHPVPFLSTIDLLRMRAGLYKPYWMEDKK